MRGQAPCTRCTHRSQPATGMPRPTDSRPAPKVGRHSTFLRVRLGRVLLGSRQRRDRSCDQVLSDALAGGADAGEGALGSARLERHPPRREDRVSDRQWELARRRASQSFRQVLASGARWHLFAAGVLPHCRGNLPIPLASQSGWAGCLGRARVTERLACPPFRPHLSPWLRTRKTSRCGTSPWSANNMEGSDERDL
jgi:hypothetical protein